MLDQNTDRMWYVIGAVLIGAAIILIANGSIPQMFASVTDSFEEVADNATGKLESIRPINDNLLLGVDREYGIWLNAAGEDYEGEDYVFATEPIPVDSSKEYAIVMTGDFENINPKTGEWYDTTAILEYDANGRIINRITNNDKRVATISFREDTQYVRYSGKLAGSDLIEGLNGHGLYQLEEGAR